MSISVIFSPDPTFLTVPAEAEAMAMVAETTTGTTEEGEDAEENGSRHGYGSKLANILSKGLCILGLNFKQ